MLIRIRELHKQYGKKIILDIPDFCLEKGIYWLRGPNGSGKTTLSKIVAGIVPARGDIIIRDQLSLSEHPFKYRRVVNFGEAEPQYPGFLTAADLIRFYAEAKKSAEQQVSELKDAFGIDPFVHQPCGTYSSGMLKRLSLVLAFIGDPALVVLDEPVNALDADAHMVLDQMINRYHKHYNTSFILASHEAITVACDGYLTIKNQTLLMDAS